MTPVITESDNKIEFSERLCLVARILIMALGFLPLIAPYELLIKHPWSVRLNLAIIMPLLISLGAIAVSVLFFIAALLGLNQRIRFDGATKVLTYGSSCVFICYRETQHSFNDIERIDIKTYDWTDGPSTYNIQVFLKNSRRTFEFGNFEAQSEAEHYSNVLQNMVSNKDRLSC